MNKAPEKWQDKVRKDYNGIISSEQIEATIKYWESFIEAEKRAAVKEALSEIKSDLAKQTIYSCRTGSHLSIYWVERIIAAQEAKLGKEQQ